MYFPNIKMAVYCEILYLEDGSKQYVIINIIIKLVS